MLYIKGRVPAHVSKISRTVIYNRDSPSRMWEIKHQRVLQVTLLSSVILPINFVLKRNGLIIYLFTFKHVAGRIFQIANIVPSLIK